MQNCRKECKEWRLGSTRYKEIYFSPEDYVDKKLKQTKHKWKNIALVTYPFIIGLEQCGPNLYSQKAKSSNIFWEHVFKAYRLLYYRIEPQNSSELLAEPVLHNERIKIGNKVISYT